MPKDLRSFIAELEAKHPEEVARVTKSISPRYEITAPAHAIGKSQTLSAALLREGRRRRCAGGDERPGEPQADGAGAGVPAGRIGGEVHRAPGQTDGAGGS